MQQWNKPGFSSVLSCEGESGEDINPSPKTKPYIDWSYTTRKTKKLLKFDAQQSQITDYIKIASAVDKVVHNNPLVSSLIKENNKHTHTREFSTPLLQQLFVNAQNNSKHLPKQKRHAEVIKKFSMSVLFMAGPSAYDLIHQNMPDLYHHFQLSGKK